MTFLNNVIGKALTRADGLLHKKISSTHRVLCFYSCNLLTKGRHMFLTNVTFDIIGDKPQGKIGLSMFQPDSKEGDKIVVFCVYISSQNN